MDFMGLADWHVSVSKKLALTSRFDATASLLPIPVTFESPAQGPAGRESAEAIVRIDWFSVRGSFQMG